MACLEASQRLYGNGFLFSFLAGRKRWSFEEKRNRLIDPYGNWARLSRLVLAEFSVVS